MRPVESRRNVVGDLTNGEVASPRSPMARLTCLLTAPLAWSSVIGCALAGCGMVDGLAKTSNALTVPVPTVSQFAILAMRSVMLGDRNTVSGGDIGVAASSGGAPNSLIGGIDSRLGVGEVLLAQVVTLRDRTIAGEIGANQINTSSGVMTARDRRLLRRLSAPPRVPSPWGPRPSRSTARRRGTCHPENTAP